MAGAPDLKRMTSELRRQRSAIVLRDADPAKLAEKLFWGAFTNCARCAARGEAHLRARGSLSELSSRLVDIARKVKVGDGLDLTSQLGPIKQQDAVRAAWRARRGCAQARAKVLTGGAQIVQDGELHTSRRSWGRVGRHPHRRRGAVRPVCAHPLPRRRRRGSSARTPPISALGIGVGQRSRARDGGRRAPLVRHKLGEHAPRGSMPMRRFGGAKWSGIGVETAPGPARLTELQTVHVSKI